MEHIFRKGTNEKKPTLLLLHGTGGTEQSLLPLAEMIDPTASVLSVRGKVLENGMPRFFRRIAEGILDEEDLVFRTKELNAFLDEAASEYGWSRRHIVAIGYSNGANIAASLLFHFEDALSGAILHHPMVPMRGVKLPNLQDVPVFIGAGKNDPLCAPEESIELDNMLSDAHAQVHLHWENLGHQLSQGEVDAAKVWYEKNFG